MKKAFIFSVIMASQFVAMAQTKLQVIHNCADAIADSVDVYLDNTKLLDNFAFRTATPFIDAPTGVPVTLSVAPKNSTSVTDTIYSITVTLSATNKYVLVANGLVSTTGYAPGASTVPFRLSIYNMARQVSTTAGNTDILVVHGSTDAPTVDVKAGASTLVNDISFGAFCSTGYISVPEADYTLDVTTSAGTTIVKRYSAPLAALNLGDSAITVVASGFLDSTVNSNGKSFGLWVALQKGGKLIQLPSLALPSFVSELNNEGRIQVYPNPANSYIDVVSTENMANIKVMDLTGRIWANAGNGNNVRIDVSKLGAGFYIIQAEGENGVATIQQFVKQ